MLLLMTRAFYALWSMPISSWRVNVIKFVDLISDIQVLGCIDTFQHLDAHSSDWHDLPSYIQNPLNTNAVHTYINVSVVPAPVDIDEVC